MRRMPKRELKGLSIAIGCLFVITALFGMVSPAKSWPVVVKDYGDFALVSPGGSYSFDQIWDLTRGDLVLTYTIDLSGAKALYPIWNPSGWWETWHCPWTSVGLTGGTHGWMCSGVPYVYDDPQVDGVPKHPNPNTQNLADKHNLQSVGGADERAYDVKSDGTVVSPPFGSGSNYGIWFDRDGVDAWQDDDPTTPAPGGSTVHWGVENGATYNTSGVYDIVVTYHAISSSLGTMFATVNGIQTGFYTTSSSTGPQIYPAGKSISGDLTKARFFVSMWAPASEELCGSVTVNDAVVSGVLATIPVEIDIKPGSDPNSICLKDNGLLPVAVLGSSVLDVYRIVPDSLMLGVDPTFVDLATRGPPKAPKLAMSYEDVNCDGIVDLIGFFAVQELYADGTGPLTESTTQLSLTGNLDNGNPIMGSDFIRVVP